MLPHDAAAGDRIENASLLLRHEGQNMVSLKVPEFSPQSSSEECLATGARAAVWRKYCGGGDMVTLAEHQQFLA